MTQAASIPKDAWDIPYDGSTHDDPLLGSLQIITRILRSPRSADSLTAGLPLVNNKLTPELLVRAARRADLSARIVKRPLTGISNLVTPAILLLNNGR
ncbi:MAG: type I secretion system permease/ATPase, partial [Gammaproteobacteria bacterium]|nr:type I secretion system permease/ATPase [Gammaproteobacteria bacterium]